MVYKYLNSQNNSIHKNRSMIMYRTVLIQYHQKVGRDLQIIYLFCNASTEELILKWVLTYKMKKILRGIFEIH